MSTFDTAVTAVLSYEGGYVNDPNDPGGETNWRISKRAYPNLDIKNLTRDQAIQIYRRDYWDSLECDRFPPLIAIALFDAAVNQGPSVLPFRNRGSWVSSAPATIPRPRE